MARWFFDMMKKGSGAMPTHGFTVSVREVTCEFGKSTGWQAVMKIYKDGSSREICNTIWQDYYSAKHDCDEMCENAAVWLNA